MGEEREEVLDEEERVGGEELRDLGESFFLYGRRVVSTLDEEVGEGKISARYWSVFLGGKGLGGEGDGWRQG
jgi:hypothetical protein